mmetsp:Transcript_28538/g.66127  ORF Transcript_28538/g.66127 Transcript_28538/m.66127 type:complete len:659 (+) Transcript_28538:88-2064(+)
MFAASSHPVAHYPAPIAAHTVPASGGGAMVAPHPHGAVASPPHTRPGRAGTPYVSHEAAQHGLVRYSGRYLPGSSVEVWSDTEKKFLHAQVIETHGNIVKVQYVHPSTGSTVQKGVDIALNGDKIRALHYGHSQSSSSPADVPPRPFQPASRVAPKDADGPGSGGARVVKRPVHIRNKVGTERDACSKGCMCKERDEEHLQKLAHPFDDDYLAACARCGVHPEERSLRNLFCWIDADDSGKITREEFDQALPQLVHLLGDDFRLSPEAWSMLDDDGNGLINFHEFAEWAGPRLGLPLGIRHLFKRRSTTLDMGSMLCCIMGCPCEGYQEMKAGHKRHTLFTRALAGIPRGALPESAMRAFGDDGQLQLCACGHKKSAHAVRRPQPGEVPYPDYWGLPPQPTGGEKPPEFLNIVETGADRLPLFQHLFDQTYRPIWTRDRRRHNPQSPNVPAQFIVTKAFRVENSKLWREYVVRRQLLLDACEKVHSEHPDALHLYTDIKTVEAWHSFPGQGGERLEKGCNEWYLFHGTSPEAAHHICESDFKINFAGVNTGTLYGRGAYFAESITKADEYAKHDANLEYAVLLCRVLGGHVLYTDDVQPDPEELVRGCSMGTYDCVLGDREKCRGTYREFVVFDTEDVYPEYIVHYRRHGEVLKPGTS